MFVKGIAAGNIDLNYQISIEVKGMHITKKQQDYLLKAVHAFKRKFFVISPDFEILAVNEQGLKSSNTEIVGGYCYEQFRNLQKPCEHCPALESLQTRIPTFLGNHSISQEKIACIFSYPLLSDGKIDALVMVDFDLPVQVWLEEQMNQSSTFLHNLLLSSVDGVVAADRRGKLVIFNHSVSEILGYGIDEALEKLNVRDIYVDENEAADVMHKLRSNEYGGKGKLKAHHVELRGDARFYQSYQRLLITGLIAGQECLQVFYAQFENLVRRQTGLFGNLFPVGRWAWLCESDGGC